MTTRLRSVAVESRYRVYEPPVWHRVWTEIRDRAELAFANVMRPLAVPALGGVFSAVMLFNLCVVPAYPVQSKPAVDVQTPLMTEAWLKDQLAEEAASGSFAMDILVDDMGRMAGYAFDSDHSLDDNARRKLVDILSRSKFQPATKFGKPKMSKIRLHLVQVKG